MAGCFEPLVIAYVQGDEVPAEQAQQIQGETENIETNPALAGRRAIG